MAKTVQSRKARGRIFQQWIRDKLIEILGIKPEDCQSRSMGAAGTDLILSLAARERFPYAVEAKNQQSVSIWAAYKQACENKDDTTEPVLFIKRNNTKPLVVIDAEYFITLHKRGTKGD